MANASRTGSVAGYGTRLRAALRGVAAIVTEFDPDRFSGADAERLTEMFAWGERLCATGKALAAGRVAATGVWQASGERSAADWLGRVSGQTSAAAAATLGTARRYRNQPGVEAAARSGELSESQGAAVSEAAEVAPQAAEELLDEARGGSLAGLREHSRRIRLGAQEEAAEKDRHRAIHAGRYLRSWTDGDGSGRLTGRFTPEALAAIVSALKPFHEEILGEARSAGRREKRDCYAADALVAMARAVTGQDTRPCDPNRADDDGSDDGPCSDLAVAPSGPDGPDDAGPHDPGRGCVASGRSDQRTAGPDERTAGPGERCGGPDQRAGGADGAAGKPVLGRVRSAATVIVRIDHAALVRGWRQADECCEIDGIGLVPVATVRAMMSDAFLAAVVTDGVDIRSVVHLGRAVTARQRTALVARDPKCVIPGCAVRRGLEIDHVEEWAPSRVTRVDSLARLCRYHHAQKTYEGWRLTGPPGQWTWTGPGHTPPDAPDPLGGSAPRGSPRDAGPDPVRHEPDQSEGPRSAVPTPATLFDLTGEHFPP